MSPSKSFCIFHPTIVFEGDLQQLEDDATQNIWTGSEKLTQNLCGIVSSQVNENIVCYYSMILEEER